MSLVVEDGSIVAGANSYTDLSNARLVAEELGVTLPVDDTEAELSLKQGARYVDQQEASFGGSRVSADQNMSWPRDGAYNSFGFEIPSDSVPNQMICGQVTAAGEYGKGIVTSPNNDGKNIQSQEVVGAVKQSFFNNGKTGKSIVLTAAIDCIRPLMINSTSAFTFRVSRG